MKVKMYPVFVFGLCCLLTAAGCESIQPGSKIPYKADVGLSVDTQALGQIRLPLNKTGELTTPTIPQIDKFDLKKFLWVDFLFGSILPGTGLLE